MISQDESLHDQAFLSHQAVEQTVLVAALHA